MSSEPQPARNDARYQRVPGCTGRACLSVIPCESPCDPPEPEYLECERCLQAVAVDEIDENGRCGRCAEAVR